MPDADAPNPGQPITRVVVGDAVLPDAKQVSRVEMRQIRILAGYAAGLHVHNGPVVGSILTGSVAFQVDGGPASVLGPGDVFYEPEGARIRRFDAGDEDVTFLAYFLLEPGQEPALEMLDG